jgi:hypothetical protein
VISFIGWLVTIFTFVATVVCLYGVIDEWRHGPRRKRRHRDDHDA